jgi:hypothetical protein
MSISVVQIIPEQGSHSILILEPIKVHPHKISPRIHTILKEINRCIDVPFF